MIDKKVNIAETFILIETMGHCVKSVQIRGYFWSVFSYIWTEYRKIRTINNFLFGHFSRNGNEWITHTELAIHKYSFLVVGLEKHQCDKF